MPEFLEKKLKKRYGPKSAIPYKIMNSMGAMRGNKETSKGKAMERKHEMKSLGGPPKMKKMKKKKKMKPEDKFVRALNS